MPEAGSGSKSVSKSATRSASGSSPEPGPEPAPPQTVTPRPGGTLLGFDYGRRRIGVAVGQTLTGTASALAVVKVSDHPDWQAIASLIEQWKPVALIVGLPVAEDGTDTPLSLEAGEFGRYLQKKHKLDVFYEDERLTSFAAEERFIDARGKGSMRKKDAALKDAMAAQIILENWLQSTP